MIKPVQEIKKEVCRKWGVTLPELEGPSRHRMIALARMEAMARTRNETHLSLPEIGWLFGRRHHTTVLHADKKYKSSPELFQGPGR